MKKYLVAALTLTTLTASSEDVTPTSPVMRVPSNSPIPVRAVPKLNLKVMRPITSHVDVGSMSDLSNQTPVTPLSYTPYREIIRRESGPQLVRRSLETETPLMPFLSFPSVNED